MTSSTWRSRVCEKNSTNPSGYLGEEIAANNAQRQLVAKVSRNLGHDLKNAKEASTSGRTLIHQLVTRVWRRSSDSSYRRPPSADIAGNPARVNSLSDVVRRFGRQQRSVMPMPSTHPLERHLRPTIETDISTDAGVALTCPHCQSELHVTETHSGWRSVSAVWFGPKAGCRRDTLERFAFSPSRDVQCPICNFSIGASATSRSLATMRLRLR